VRLIDSLVRGQLIVAIALVSDACLLEAGRIIILVLRDGQTGQLHRFGTRNLGQLDLGRICAPKLVTLLAGYLCLRNRALNVSREHRLLPLHGLLHSKHISLHLRERIRVVVAIALGDRLLHPLLGLAIALVLLGLVRLQSLGHIELVHQYLVFTRRIERLLRKHSQLVRALLLLPRQPDLLGSVS